MAAKDTVSAARQAKHGGVLTAVFTVLSLLWISPLLIVLLNSFKRKAYIFKNPFGNRPNIIDPRILFYSSMV